MASSKEYLDFVLEQLSELDDISFRAMMGEYILYYRGRVFGGIYDDRLLVKPVPPAVKLMPDAAMELPYDGAKEMILVDDVDNREFLCELVRSMWEDLPEKKRNPIDGFTDIHIAIHQTPFEYAALNYSADVHACSVDICFCVHISCVQRSLQFNFASCHDSIRRKASIFFSHICGEGKVRGRIEAFHEVLPKIKVQVDEHHVQFTDPGGYVRKGSPKLGVIERSCADEKHHQVVLITEIVIEGPDRNVCFLAYSADSDMIGAFCFYEMNCSVDDLLLVVFIAVCLDRASALAWHIRPSFSEKYNEFYFYY